jgi:hypothetical protein
MKVRRKSRFVRAYDIAGIHTLCRNVRDSPHKLDIRSWIHNWPALPVSHPPRPTPSHEHPLHSGRAHPGELLPRARCSPQFPHHRHDARRSHFLVRHIWIAKEMLPDQLCVLLRELQALRVRCLHHGLRRGSIMRLVRQWRRELPSVPRSSSGRDSRFVRPNLLIGQSFGNGGARVVIDARSLLPGAIILTAPSMSRIQSSWSAKSKTGRSSGSCGLNSSCPILILPPEAPSEFAALLLSPRSPVFDPWLFPPLTPPSWTFPSRLSPKPATYRPHRPSQAAPLQPQPESYARLHLSARWAIAMATA